MHSKDNKIPFKVSVITVCFNEKNCIRQSIESVIAQTYPHIELIVIDGDSTDGTKDILKEYDSKIDFLVSEPDNGIFDAMNKGINLATGNFLYFLNADDYFINDNIVSKVAKESELHPGADIIAGHINFYNVPEHLKYKQRRNFHFKNKIQLYQKPVGQQCIFSRRTLYKNNKIGLLNVRYSICADYEWLIKCINKELNIHFIDMIFSNVDYTGISFSNNRLRKKEKREIILKNSNTKELLIFLAEGIKQKLGGGQKE